MQGEGDSETKPCELCCKLPGPSSPCRSSFEWTKAPHDVPNMYSKAGTPCNNYQGYCDVFRANDIIVIKSFNLIHNFE